MGQVNAKAPQAPGTPSAARKGAQRPAESQKYRYSSRSASASPTVFMENLGSAIKSRPKTLEVTKRSG
jgi:hypothetical protein